MSVPLPFIAIAAVILFSVAAATQPLPCASEGPEVVCTDQGAVRGVREGRTLAFEGIPYAQAPVGKLRWQPPIPAARWDGVRDGGGYGPMCPQIITDEVRGEEDCLYVNVWRPSEKPDRSLPVMVWLTGGGNHQFSGQGSGAFGGVVYNGQQVAPEGVVFVSYNLRLGALGFLAHAALDAERPERISGNYGSLDQIAMLQWIQRNIAAFGGDPSRVFLFGTSAGGGNICALITSPLTRGLIHRVAMQSSVPVGCEIQTLAEAKSGTGERVVKALGLADIASCLRGKTTKEVVAAVPGSFSVLPRLYGPNVDGHVFPEQPIKLISEKRSPAMPVIIGNTSGATGPWADTAGRITDEASYATAVDKVFGTIARDRILRVYPASAYASPRAAFVQATTDAEFTCKSRHVAHLFAQAQKEPVYRYLFSHTLENDPALKAVGAAHTIEHPFLFAWQGKYKPTETDLAIQRHIVGYWTRMAKTGNPNGGGDPEWSAVSADKDTYLDIGATLATKADGNAHCDFWEGVPLLWPHI
jgi:para-nitrobenzyl esterase